MAGGNPNEIINIYGLKLPRYQAAIAMLGIYAGIAFGVSTYNSFQPKPPIKFESKEEESFVKKYVAFMMAEEKKPLLARQEFVFDGKY